VERKTSVGRFFEFSKEPPVPVLSIFQNQIITSSGSFKTLDELTGFMKEPAMTSDSLVGSLTVRFALKTIVKCQIWFLDF